MYSNKSFILIYNAQYFVSQFSINLFGALVFEKYSKIFILQFSFYHPYKDLLDTFKVQPYSLF